MAGMLHRGYVYKLRPSAAQESAFRRFAGVCRLVYNLALEQRRDHWRRYRDINGRIISYVSQASELTALRAEFDWVAAVSSTCQQQALRDLDRAYTDFFEGRAGYPRPRRKGRDESFRFQGREVALRKINRRWSEVRLPKIGWVRYRDTRALPGKIFNVTVTLKASAWHVVFACDAEAIRQGVAPEAMVGIDRGVAVTAALSTGEMLSLPGQPVLDRRRRKARKLLARKRRGSNRWRKQKARVARLDAKVARGRHHWLHIVSRNLAARFRSIVIENLDVLGMTASARGTIEAPGRNVRAKAGLNRAIRDQGWHLFETFLAYKTAEYGGELLKVEPRHTSQTCSACGAIDPRSRESQAVFRCVTCGAVLNADHNAAINILRRNTASMRVEGPGCGPGEARTGREAA